MKASPTLLLLIGLLPFTGCQAPQQDTQLKRSAELTTPTPLLPYSLKSFTGIVEEAQEINLGFKTAGQIERIVVKEGDRVEKGQLLACLDDSDYTLGIKALEIQHEQLSHEVARLKQLYENNSLAGNDYEKAKAGLEQVGVQLQINRNKCNYTRLHAPVGGYVQNINFEEAEMVDAGTPFITLLDTHRLDVTLDIPASLYAQRKLIERISCRQLHASGEELPLKLVGITPKADGNQLYKMRLTFETLPAEEITPGLNVEVMVRLSNPNTAGAYTLPLHALFYNNGETCVWVVNDDSTVSRRSLVVDGTDETGRAIVVEGLDGDERIVNAGVNTLQEHDKVRILEHNSQTNVGGVL